MARRSSLRPSAQSLAVWVVLYQFLAGRATLALAPADTKWLHVWLSDLQTRVGEGRNTNPLFTYFFNPIRSVIDAFGTAIADLIAHPVDARPVPYIGWLGVVVLFTLLAWVLGNWKVGLLTLCGLLFMGLQGLWQDSMETLALTIAAVTISLLIGIPLGIWAGMSDPFNRLITPVLDFMQILPSFVYLAPLTLAFLIGPAAAIIATVIYAAPPVIRLTAHGIRSVPQESREAVESLGATQAPGVVRRAAADGQAHHRARHQPDHHGRAGDGDDRRADRRTRPRPGRGPGVVDPGRRHRIQRRSGDRDVGHHPGPDHHGRE